MANNTYDWVECENNYNLETEISSLALNEQNLGNTTISLFDQPSIQ